LQIIPRSKNPEKTLTMKNRLKVLKILKKRARQKWKRHQKDKNLRWKKVRNKKTNKSANLKQN